MTRADACARWMWGLGCGLIAATHAWAQNDLRLIGDVGVASYITPAITRTNDDSQVVLPYVYADYGALYARVDTFGYKLAPMGAGHFEFATRLSFEGYRSEIAGINQRARPKLFGIGTFQETSYGAFIFYAFHDAASNGSLLDASYAAELALGSFQLYPQIGIERRDHKYVQALYGVNATEAQHSSLAAYTPHRSITPNAALAIEYPLINQLKLTFQVRKRWLDHSIEGSPLVDVKQQTSRFLALTQTFH